MGDMMKMIGALILLGGVILGIGWIATGAEGTWVLMKDPNGDKTLPVYVEPRMVIVPFKLPLD